MSKQKRSNVDIPEVRECIETGLYKRIKRHHNVTTEAETLPERCNALAGAFYAALEKGQHSFNERVEFMPENLNVIKTVVDEFMAADSNISDYLFVDVERYRGEVRQELVHLAAGKLRLPANILRFKNRAYYFTISYKFTVQPSEETSDDDVIEWGWKPSTETVQRVTEALTTAKE